MHAALDGVPAPWGGGPLGRHLGRGIAAADHSTSLPVFSVFVFRPRSTAVHATRDAMALAHNAYLTALPGRALCRPPAPP